VPDSDSHRWMPVLLRVIYRPTAALVHTSAIRSQPAKIAEKADMVIGKSAKRQ